MSLVFEEPPAASEPTGRPVSEKWANVSEGLAANVGKWARIAPLPTEDDPEPAALDNVGKANGLANRIRKGQSAAFRPEGHFQAVARPHEDGYGVWARYVGEDFEDDPVGDYAAAFKVAELKAQSKERGLKISGTRRELAERILAHDEEHGAPESEEDSAPDAE